MKSCIYRGDIFHKRYQPKDHSFRYQLDYLFLNLDEIKQVFDLSAFWSANKSNLISFFESDYLPEINEQTQSLKQRVVTKLATLGVADFEGDIYLLSTLRSLGHSMNPIIMFYCYSLDEFGKPLALQYVLTEVNNTPWGERHQYLLKGPEFEQATEKDFHVSPFMPMDTQYHWTINDPATKLKVAIEVAQNETPLFDAKMVLNKVELNNYTMRNIIYSHAKQAFRTISGIYIQALNLWLKKVPFYAHPNKDNVPGN